MQLSDAGRFSVTRRISGVGKERRLYWVGGGGVLKDGIVDNFYSLREFCVGVDMRNGCM